MTSHQRLHRVSRALLAAAIAAAGLQAAAMPSPAAAAVPHQQAQVIAPVAGRDAAPHRAAAPSAATYHAPAPVWPAAGTATISFADAAHSTVPAGTRSASRLRAGSLPVSVEMPSGATMSGGPFTGGLTVTVADHAAAEAQGAALVVRLSRSAGTATGLSTPVTIDYSGFATAYGADWADRLHMTELPPGCATAGPGCWPTPLATANDGMSATATVAVPATGNAVVALTAGASGGDGDYGATPLKPSGTWSAGGNSGGFSWSYGLRMPPALGGPAPSVALSYSSQTVDGQMAATNNQTTWIGEGFAYNPGEISRSYVGCADDMGGTGANNTVSTGDQCWKTDNATLTLNGQSSELLYNASEGRWHMRSESGWRITRSTGGVNGDNDGEYWVVTTTDGTKYYFGLNRLPGYTGTSPANKVTNSVYTVAVYGNNSSEPCHATSYASSSCAQAWQWNLDYVVDTHGNTESLWYQPQANKYAANNGATVTSYTRGGYLKKIDYGTNNRSGTDSDETSALAPMTAVFTPGDRCLSGCSTHDATHWPDTPWDQSCTGTTCTVGSPTFWIDQRLASVTTRVLNGSAYKDVEQWTLHHRFPDPGDGTRAGLWLDSLSHTGLVGGSLSVPDVTFQPTPMNNRVDTALKNGLRPMNWPRLTEIDTETGEKIFVTYSAPECVSGSNMPAAPDSDTKRCYPVRWTPPDLGTEILDYFHKYVVTQVEEFDATDTTPGPQSTITKYTYVGTPAWHYSDDDGLTQAKYRTWNQWRGYSTVQTIVGTGTEQTMTKSLYFRGMNGDKLSSGTRSASVTDSKGLATLPDDDQYAGVARESTVYNGPTGPAISGTVSDPWTSSATATRTLDGTTVYARFTNTQDVHSWVALDHGRPDRWTHMHTDFEGTYGLPTAVTDYGDTAITGDETCTLTDYARNTGAWIAATMKEMRTYIMTCAAAQVAGKVFTADDILSDNRTSYDGQVWGAAPTTGSVTRQESLKDWQNNTGTFLTTATTAYDSYGRSTDSTDIDGIRTTTAYTPASGAPVTRTVATNSATTWVTTTDLEPAWGLPLGSTDPNSRRTDLAYDQLGRLTSVWRPGRAKASFPTSPNSSYAYAISATAPTVVTTKQLNPNNTYTTAYAIYDALMRQRQSQAPEAGTGGGRVVSDMFYDSAGRGYLTWGPYLASGPPSTALFSPTSGSDNIDQWSHTIYDGAGRAVEVDTNSKTGQLWHTTTAYTGDRVDSTPPAGGVATSTVTDAHGRTVELRQYHGSTATGSTDPSTYDATAYTFNAKNQLVQVRNAAGSTWARTYDLRGRQTGATDPDAGTTSSTYDDAGRVLTTTDGRGITLAYAYADALHRRTGEYLTSTSGTQLTGWAYDQAPNSRGMLTSSTRYANGNAYTSAVTAFDAAGRPTTTSITIPAAETGLAGTYTYNTGYNANGSAHTYRVPAIGGTGGLGIETLTYGYSDFGSPTTLGTTLGSGYVVSTSYTSLGQLGTVTLANNGSQAVQIGQYWDDATGRLRRIWTTREAAPSTVSDLNLSYDNAGNPTKVIQAAAVAGAETQCFQTNNLDQLTQAWTPANGDCVATPSQSNIGASPAPYWTTWTLDNAGLRRQQVEHGTPQGDRTTTYTYPAPTAVGAHELTSTSSTDNSGTAVANYGYTDSNGKNIGDTTSRPGTAGIQALTWDSENRLATVVDPTGTTGYLYDADGHQLIRRDLAGATLYLPGQELRVSLSGTLISTTRFYPHAGQTIAARSASGVTWLAGDQQGTADVAINAATGQTATVRHHTPYGSPRGVNPAWTTDRGFVGGVAENTGLTNEGARQYDSALGRFISVDPVFEVSDPGQLNGYGYTAGNPIRASDPSGTTSHDITDADSPLNKSDARCDAACIQAENHASQLSAILSTSMYGRSLSDSEYDHYKKDFHYSGSKDFTIGDALKQWNCDPSICNVVDSYSHECPKDTGSCPASSQGFFFQEICPKMGGNLQSCGAFAFDPVPAMDALANSPQPWVSVPTALTQITFAFAYGSGQDFVDGAANLLGNLSPGKGRAALAPLASFAGSGIGDPPGPNVLRPGATFYANQLGSWNSTPLAHTGRNDHYTKYTVQFPIPVSFMMLDLPDDSFVKDLQELGMISS